MVSPAGWARLGAALEAGSGPAGQDRVDGQLDRGRRRRRRAPARSLPYWLGAGLDVRWAVVQARPEFFSDHETDSQHASRACRRRGELGERERRVYEASLAPNAVLAGAPGSCGRHRGPPRPADRGPGSGTQGTRRERRLAVARRRRPSQRARPGGLGLSASILSYADAIVFTRRSSAPLWLGASRVAVIPPSIDPCATKNRAMDDRAVRAILTRAGLAEGSLGPVGRPAFRRRDGSEGQVGAPHASFAERVGRCGSTSIPSSCTSLAGIA